MSKTDINTILPTRPKMMVYMYIKIQGMMMVMMMNCFCGMIDQQRVFSLISSRDHCQRSLLLQISDTPLTGFELMQMLSLGFIE